MKTGQLKGLCILSLVMIPETAFSSSTGHFERGSSHQYTHLIETYQSQTFESLSQTALFSEQSVFENSYKTAGVYFITNDNGQVFSGIGRNNGDIEFEDPSVRRCKNEDYKLTSCSQGTPAEKCPYNSSYFKTCCDAGYKYTSSSCSYPNTLSKEGCGGKYKCECDTTLYPITDCTSPQVPKTGSGTSCVSEGKTYYAECVCPEVYSEMCNGTHLKGKGVSCSKNGEVKYISCECDSGYTMTCSGNGLSPLNPSDYCLNGGVRYYNNCKQCENKCSLASCPQGVVCEKESCSGKYCDIGCAVTEGYEDLDNYWCDGALRCLAGGA